MTSKDHFRHTFYLSSEIHIDPKMISPIQTTALWIKLCLLERFKSAAFVREISTYRTCETSYAY